VRELCRLNEREAAAVASLPEGSALWKVGDRVFQAEDALGARGEFTGGVRVRW